MNAPLLGQFGHGCLVSSSFGFVLILIFLLLLNVFWLGRCVIKLKSIAAVVAIF